MTPFAPFFAARHPPPVRHHEQSVAIQGWRPRRIEYDVPALLSPHYPARHRRTNKTRHLQNVDRTGNNGMSVLEIIMMSPHFMFPYFPRISPAFPRPRQDPRGAHLHGGRRRGRGDDRIACLSRAAALNAIEMDRNGRQQAGAVALGDNSARLRTRLSEGAQQAFQKRGPHVLRHHPDEQRQGRNDDCDDGQQP